MTCGLLITAASLVAEHSLSARGLNSCDPRALEHRLSSCDPRALEHRLSSCDPRALEHTLGSCSAQA